MKLDEKTSIPISLILTFSGALFGLAGVYYQTYANASDIVKMETEYKGHYKRVEEKLELILQRLVRIESKMEDK